MLPAYNNTNDIIRELGEQWISEIKNIKSEN
jgi:hypothetical protein